MSFSPKSFNLSKFSLQWDKILSGNFFFNTSAASIIELNSLFNISISVVTSCPLTIFLSNSSMVCLTSGASPLPVEAQLASILDEWSAKVIIYGAKSP